MAHRDQLFSKPIFKKTFSCCIFFGLVIYSSCKKTGEIVPAASLNVINASPGIVMAQVATPYADGYFSQRIGVYYSSNQVYTVPAGKAAVSVANSADTIKPLFDSTFSTKASDIYSCFIAGPEGNDFVISKDIIPAHADSSFGVRFINLSYNSQAVNLTLVASLATRQFSDITYRALTDFKTYPATTADAADYNFQVMDGNNNILASLDVQTSVYVKKNITLVFTGNIGSTGPDAPILFSVNNY